MDKEENKEKSSAKGDTDSATQSKSESEKNSGTGKTTVVTAMLPEARLPDIQDENTREAGRINSGEKEEEDKRRDFPAAPQSTPNRGGPVNEPRHRAPEYGYNQGQNSGSNPGGRAYGQSYGQYHHDSYRRENYSPRDYRGDYDPYYDRPRNYPEQDHLQGGDQRYRYEESRDRGYRSGYQDNQNYREQRNNPDRRNEDNYYGRGAYDQRSGGYERDDYRDNLDRGYYRDRYRSEENPAQDHNREREYDRPPYRSEYDDFQYRDYGHQSYGQSEGFGMRDSRRHRGHWDEDDDYPGGHVHRRTGSGRYGSR